MEHNNPHRQFGIRLLRALILSAFLVGVLPTDAVASTWDPTLLVNTEAFEIIDDGDGTSPIFLQFGDSANERLTWDTAQSEFEFTDDLSVEGNLGVTGNITSSGTLTINNDNSGDATINFGGSVVETLIFNATTGRFEFSDDIHATGNVFGSGNLSIEGTGHVQGKLTTSGALTVESNIDQRGSTLEINSDAGAGDINLTFGNQSGDETLLFNDTTDRFEFTDDLSVEGNMSGNSLTVTTGTVSINGVGYSFTGTQGGAGTILTNDGAGNLTWSTSTVADGSGSFLSFHPEYPNATYAGTGATTVGQLSLNSSGSTAGANYYRWTTTQATAQRYQIVVRVRVPNNFDSWAAGTGMILQYRTDDTATANNYVQFKVWDTAGALDHNSGQLTSANATGFVTALATPANLNGTYTPGRDMTVRITVMATTGNPVDVGYLNIQWKTNTP